MKAPRLNKIFRTEVFGLVLILLLSILLRLYKLPEYMTFLGDEGRDAIVVKNILVNHHLPLLGPTSSVGNIYLGPLYYYMMAASMSVWWLNPIAAAVMVALLGTAAVGLVYYLTRQWGNSIGASVAAILYSISPVNIIYSRSSWNPDPAPFFALLGVVGFYKSHQTKNYLWLALTGFAIAAAVQMHYLSLILLPVFGVIWIRETVSLKVTQSAIQNLGKGTLLAVLAFLLTMLPLVIFDLRHNFMNFHALNTIFSGQDSAVSFNIFDGLGRFGLVYSTLVMDYLSGNSIWLFVISTPLILLPLAVFAYQVYSGRFNWSSFILLVWLLGGVLGLTLYKGAIYDHYLMPINPIPFILIGLAVSMVIGHYREWWVRAILFVFLGGLIFVNLQKSPLLLPPGNQLQRTQQVAQFIINESGSRDFNFALIAARNYDAAYQYYLDLYGHQPKIVPLEITDQLFVVCEDAVCQPINNAKYEIAGFGWSKIAYEKDVAGVKLFKLVSNPNGAK